MKKPREIRQGQRKRIAVFLLFVHTILLSITEAVITQYVMLNKFPDTLAWIIPYFKPFFVTVLILLVVNIFLYLITLNKWVPLAVTYPLIVLISIINYQKVLLRNEPFLPTDIVNYKEAMGISSTFSLEFRKVYFICIIIFVVFLAALFFIRSVKFKLKTRLITLVTTVILMVPLSYGIVFSKNSLLERSYYETVWDLDLEYNQNGLINAMLENIKRIKYKEPEGYSEESVQKAADDLGYVDPEVSELSDEQKPNIIVIMNESWYDDSMFTAVNLNPNPLSPITDLTKNSNAVFGYALSGQLGGGTSNPEFEFLTGKSSSFFPWGSMIYKNYMNDKQWSLAEYFNLLGYNTFATHGYLDWFWNRRDVYEDFGFDKMTFSEDLHFAEKKGMYISDMSIAKELIYELNQNKSQPNFLFAVTMQNHSTYSGDRYENYNIEVTAKDEKVSPLIPEILCHAEGVYDGSQMFCYLAQQLKEETRPTYILMFGDHSPYMASYPSVFLDKNSENDKFNSYKIPVAMWSNSPEKLPTFPLVATYNLPTIMLESAKVPLPQYMNVNKCAMNVTTGITWQYTLDSKGLLVTEKIPRIEQVRGDLEMLQYDALYGNQFLIKK
ncbi:MAG: LTA synthase family protein [Clostridia bacterium]